MSLPPQIIRVKRKRVDETPVTFLQLDEGTKRHRSGSNWVYQRRNSTTQPQPQRQRQQQPAVRHANARPVIHVAGASQYKPTPDAPKVSINDTPTIGNNAAVSGSNEPRRFHVSRSMLAAGAQSIFKGGRRGPALFVERTKRRKLVAKTRRSLGGSALQTELDNQTPITGQRIEQKDLKKPGVTNRAKSKEDMEEKDTQARNPLPASMMNRENDDMNKIAADMNEWVMREVGANLESMEEETRQQAKPRFKPKAPEKRYQERHPEVKTATDREVDMQNAPGSEASDEEGEGEGDDWVIEEYVRIPANSMKRDVLPSDVGFLVLEGEEDSLLFYGSLNDEEDDLDEDEEDENAENHYAADYPEDEDDSDDDLQAYLYRNRNASDEEEFDQDDYDDDDEIAMEGDMDDESRMARIVEQIKRHRIDSTQQYQ